MTSHVSQERRLVPESIRANVAGEGSFARVSGEVIPEMFPRLEFLAALPTIDCRIPGLMIFGRDSLGTELRYTR